MQPATALPPLSEVICSVCLINRKSEVASSTIYPKVTSETFDEWVVREVTDFECIKGLEFRDSLGSLASHNVGFYRGVMGIWGRF
jgi:sorting nexin-4